MRAAAGVRWVGEHVFVRNRDEFELVMRRAASGVSDYEIARSTGVPRSTVQAWRRRARPPRGLSPPPTCAWRPGHPRTYAYLLGLYLGDGYIWRTGRESWRLCLSLDARYPGVVSEAVAAVQRIGDSPVRVNARSGASLVLASCAIWPRAFPQHGPGKKHERPIRLHAWQRAITATHPDAVLRGLVHSDGCRVTNRFRTRLAGGRVAEYAYPRYFFSNLSADIREIFSDHCELLGIRWSQPNSRNISVSNRASVRIMDGFIGPKR